MTVTNNNVPLLHRKEWHPMCVTPVTTAAGMCVIADQSDYGDWAMFLTSATVPYIYHHDEDAFVQVASPALAGTFGAGTCGVFHPWSITYTANGGSTTTVTVNAATFNITGLCVGKKIEFLSGSNIGLKRTITNILHLGGTGTTTITFDTPVTSVANNDTFRISTGKYYVMNGGTIAAGIFKVFDMGTLTWQANLATANLPATFATDGRMACAYMLNSTLDSGLAYATGTATSGAATTLTNTPKTWTTNQWTNYQVHITAGTGIGQVRTIASNTNNVLTVSSAWTVNPDATSVYAIEGNEDYLYLSGNNAVTVYRYSISANTWTVMAPTVARAAAPGAGMSFDCVFVTGDSGWANESDIKDGRYLYSLRGVGGTAIDRFDIAGGTAGAGAWTAITYQGTEGFTTGSAACVDNEFIYLRQNATHRFFKYDVVKNYVEPLSTNMNPDGAALLGNKLWVKELDSTGSVKWLYSMKNTGTEVHRLMLY